MLQSVKFQVVTWVSVLPEFKGFSIDTMMSSWHEIVLSSPWSPRSFPRWSPPNAGFLKLNFDGSARGNPGLIGIGGIIRDSSGSSLLSFSSPSGFCSVNEVELLALRWSLPSGSFGFV